MIVDFGFDLAGRKEAGLRRGFALGVAAAFFEAVPYVELCRVLIAVFEGHAGIGLAIEAALVLLLSMLALIVLKARAATENFRATYGLVADARLNVADHLHRLPMGLFTAARRSVIAELLTGRFGLYQDVVTHVWGLAVVNVALPVFLWLVLLVVDWRLALVAAALVPVALLAIPWSHRVLARAADRLLDVRNEAVGGIVDQIEGVRELAQYDRRQARLRLVDAQIERLKDEQMRLELAPAPALLAFNVVLQFGFALTAIVAAWLVAGGTVEAAGLILFLVLALRFYRAISELGVNLAELRFARDTLAQIRRLAAERTLPERADARTPTDASVEFDDVSFSYGEGEALRALSGRIEDGRMIALVGPSGAGKSTLAQLVARLWDVDSGAIRIGGVDVRDMSAETLNRTVAMVLQEVVLFEGTVADNIRLGRPDASDTEVVAAAKAARADGFIAALPLGYDTRLDGVSMSGGERQRLAIARALLKDAPVLILDEATANVDLEAEADIQSALSALTRRRTVLVIAHRLWTVVDVDEIWVMDGGRIVQRGPHARLLEETGGVYRRLWGAQAQARSWRILSAPARNQESLISNP
jgi:ATP-binding cassette, subfamily B, bacterial IrtB/YbtQ